MMSDTQDPQSNRPFRILSLDGGGAKGTYTLGFLFQLEKKLGVPLADHFDMVYGTSTGAIIASMVGLKFPVQDICEKYLKHVPRIMSCWTAGGKSKALAELADDVFGKKTFVDFHTYVGVVATNWTNRRPLIFKSSPNGAFSSLATFKPGWGCTIAQAVCASAAAAPFFRKVELDLGDHGKALTVDGGFFANNPSLTALTDATGVKAFNMPQQRIRLLTVGCGHFPEKKRSWITERCKRIPTAQLLQTVLSANATATEIQCDFLFPHVRKLRINEAYTTPELATDFLESDRKKLEALYQKGFHTYQSKEAAVEALLQ